MKIGIVGCGKIANRHLNAYRKIRGLEIKVSDIDREVARVFSRNQEVESVGNMEALFESEEIDVIDVCTPTPCHAEIIMKAIDHDKHVFCEKPLTDSLEKANQIREKLEESDKIVMVGYLYRFHPAFQKTKEILKEGIIGRPYNAIFRVGGRGSHRSWKHKTKEGGGVMNEMMAHMLDLIIWYFGSIISAENLMTDTLLETRQIGGNEIKADAEDISLLRIKTSSGVNILCESDLITPSYMNYIEIQGTNGSLWTSILDYFPTIIYCKKSRGLYNQGNNFFRFSMVDLFEKELNYFIDKIENKEKPDLNSIDDSIKGLEVVERVKS
jgi:predicted dehydrogenase